MVDFGCGNAKLGRSVPNKVHSFDLVAVNKDVTVADMKNVSKIIYVSLCITKRGCDKLQVIFHLILFLFYFRSLLNQEVLTLLFSHYH